MHETPKDRSAVFVIWVASMRITLDPPSPLAPSAHAVGLRASQNVDRRSECHSIAFMSAQSPSLFHPSPTTQFRIPCTLC